MWILLEHRRIVKQVSRLPTEVLKRYEKWKDVVAISGPQGLRLIKGFHDEALRGGWQGFRSSRLGSQHRAIYRVKASEILIEIVEINAHDYRNK
mgnify:CR=1 FL=1